MGQGGREGEEVEGYYVGEHFVKEESRKARSLFTPKLYNSLRTTAVFDVWADTERIESLM